MKTNLVLGILAHVDAGKTTLAESILYHGGSIRKLGRVDHQDAFLDHHALERERGITIFSKQAELWLGEQPVTLLDTPGHVDFVAETERTLPVLDGAILLVNASDGVRDHTRTLWRLLKKYQIPVFIFVNKMDLPDTDKDRLLTQLRQCFGERCLDFSAGLDDKETPEREAFWEELALCDEALMDKYLATGKMEAEDIAALVKDRKVFPCYFGAALKNAGVAELLQGIARYARVPEYGADFGARVFKIVRDGQNNRLTYLKITGGSLRVKATLAVPPKTGAETGTVPEKVNQIRIYSGNHFRVAERAEAGTVCAVTGLETTWPGVGLGREKPGTAPVLLPVLTYRIGLPEGVSAYVMYTQLCQLEEEEPLLHITWEENAGEIRVRVMGEVQIEILQRIIRERFQVAVEFDRGKIVYRETIAAAVKGMGHFEPLRHYAEVHLLLEPLPPGSGLQLANRCREEVLARNWQRLVMTHLEEKLPRGVLTGAALTDMRITLMGGRAHLKHTEGGDFRQAAYRAVRQGLMGAENILLEPVYGFSLEVPTRVVGRAMTDIKRMKGNFEPPRTVGEMTLLNGSAPVATMQGYPTEVAAYTGGAGRLSCFLKGYEPCHNMAEVLAQQGYDPEADTEHPAGSVFCAHGAGFLVPWDEVADYMHLDVDWSFADQAVAEESTGAGSDVLGRCDFSMPQRNRENTGISDRLPGTDRSSGERSASKARTPAETEKEEKELAEIFRRTYGPGKERGSGGNRHSAKKTVVAGADPEIATPTERNHPPKHKSQPGQPAEYLLVDGYNIIHAWKELRELAEINLAAARQQLADILCNYQGYKNNTVILVFDAYRVEGHPGTESQYFNIHIVYTKEAETADMYIEKVTHEIGRKYQVTVATSDALEQMIVWGQGAARLSAEGLRTEILAENARNREEYQGQSSKRNYLFDHLPTELADLMEAVRLGKRDLPP